MESVIENIIEKSLENSYSYAEYRNLVANLAKKGASTGPEQNEALAQYTQLNNSRMKRWDKTLKFSDEAIAKIKSVDHKIKWVVLTESWCGDASPALPVISKIAELNTNISLSIILRDENLEVMNRFLTNGSMSIPKLIAMDTDEDTIVATWGPRSMKATQLVEEYRAKYGLLTPELKQDLQVFYNKDKGQSVLDDILKLLPLK
ncbi:thioredoxin family protein [Maribacter hydrothermalis]|uniref:Thioredoxin n=1 Tax=Maribacter hydrothermalis TaxID=1836467 RepID=A0A1B7Z3I7_9FLAO|nr:thioredoxin family protein [Maribacter hydrothermalis]APQ17030.1 thioredoxin family protein [Maribacter hydrothermalis]OBR37291.1 thioredoxin [Maribacter hydrothermalis]